MLYTAFHWEYNAVHITINQMSEEDEKNIVNNWVSQSTQSASFARVVLVMVWCDKLFSFSPAKLINILV